MKQSQERKLGRGLSALMGESREKKKESISGSNSKSSDSVSSVSVEKIIAGVYQPRKHFSSEEIYELSISIKESGCLSKLCF